MPMRPSPLFARPLAALLLSTLALSACAYSKPNPTPMNYGGLGSGSPGDAASIGRLGGEESGMVLGVGKERDRGKSDSGGIGVNGDLWRGALETLGFMPLNAIDPHGGVIITDWYTPAAATGERFKATAYILSKELRSDGVQVTVFRQVLQGGQWVDSPMPESTASELENKILARARKMRELRLGNS